jgi:hypothetical protein
VKAVWEPEWAVRVRTKSAALMPLGDHAMAGPGGQQPATQNPTESARPPSALDMLRGVLGR